MKKLILKSMVAISLMTVLSGCESEDEKKAKDIVVQNILKEEARAKEHEKNKGKHPDLSNFSWEVKETKEQKAMQEARRVKAEKENAELKRLNAEFLKERTKER